MARGFTDIAIKNLKPEDKRREIPRFDGKPRKLSLGNISLSAARKAAAHAHHEVAEGRDPAAAKKAARAERKAIEADTFAAIAERYFTIECGLRRAGENLTFNGKLRTPCDSSVTVSFSGHLVALMRLRNSSSSACGTSILNCRSASLAVAARACMAIKLEAATAAEAARTSRRSGSLTMFI
jgi:hypothetical protein